MGKRTRLAATMALGITLVMLYVAPVSADQTERTDVITYAKLEHITFAEAERRLELSDMAGQLELTLAAHFGATFGGVWIEQRPSFRVIVALTSDMSADLENIVAGSRLAPFVHERVVATSFRTLERDLSAIAWLARERLADLMLDVRTNRIEARVRNEREVRDLARARGVAIPSTVRMTTVTALAEPAANLYGGLSLTDSGGSPLCTSGFTVVNNGTSDRGVTTAGHCADSLFFSGSSLTFQSANANASHDEQWHTAWQHTFKNWVKDPTQGTGTRSITSRTARSSQVVGSLACKYGNSTGYGCGYIGSKNSSGCLPQGGTEYIFLQNNGLDLGDLGDSGGPVFKESSAYGIISCVNSGASGRDLIYVAVDYVESGLGVTVLTTP